MAHLTVQLKQLSFEGIAFPYEEIKVAGAMRHHVHEYPHSPGGLPEKLGRQLYGFDITIPFFGDLTPEQYKNLWPFNLDQLVQLFEQGKTGDLVLPQIGAPVRAFCTNWDRTLSARVTNGERVTLKFLEDQESLRLSSSLFLDITAANLDTAYAAVQKKALDLPKKGLLDSILGAVSQILAIRDQFDLYSNLLEAKLLSVISMIRQIIETWDYIKDPSQWEAVDALHELLAQTRALYKDQQQKGLTTSVHSVRRDGTLAQVSTEIYGVSTRAKDLLMLNRIPDPFLIRAATKIRYYADAA